MKSAATDWGSYTTRVIIVFGFILSATAAYPQEPVRSPSQQERVAKRPWSVALQIAPFKQETVTFTLAPKEAMGPDQWRQSTRQGPPRKNSRPRDPVTLTENSDAETGPVPVNSKLSLERGRD